MAAIEPALIQLRHCKQTRKQLIRLERPTVFLFYSERPLTREQEQEFARAGIMVCDGQRVLQG